jgi:hypothetical protein
LCWLWRKHAIASGAPIEAHDFPKCVVEALLDCDACAHGGVCSFMDTRRLESPVEVCGDDHAAGASDASDSDIGSETVSDESDAIEQPQKRPRKNCAGSAATSAKAAGKRDKRESKRKKRNVRKILVSALRL